MRTMTRRTTTTTPSLTLMTSEPSGSEHYRAPSKTQPWQSVNYARPFPLPTLGDEQREEEGGEHKSQDGEEEGGGNTPGRVVVVVPWCGDEVDVEVEVE